MKIKIIKKYINLTEAFIERSLPNFGTISVKIGDRVNSYDQIGEASFSSQSETVMYTGVPLVKEQDRVYSGDILAKDKKYLVKKVDYRSKISGVVTKVDEVAKFIQIESLVKRYTLISGVSGQVVDISKNFSALIKSPASVVRGVAGGGPEVGAEILVLKDADFIEDALINEKVSGKIIFANRISESAIKKAKTFGCMGFVISSCDYNFFKNCIKEDTSIIITEGFGDLKFNSYLVQLLDQLTSKFALLRTHDKSLVLPVDKEVGKFFFPANRVEEFEAEAKVGDRVFVLNRDLFGAVGKISNISNDSNLIEVDVLGFKREFSNDLVALVG